MESTLSDTRQYGDFARIQNLNQRLSGREAGILLVCSLALWGTSVSLAAGQAADGDWGGVKITQGIAASIQEPKTVIIPHRKGLTHREEAPRTRLKRNAKRETKLLCASRTLHFGP